MRKENMIPGWEKLLVDFLIKLDIMADKETCKIEMSITDGGFAWLNKTNITKYK